MIIGFDAKRAFYNKSGLGTYSRNMINGLAEKFPDHNYFLYTPGRNDSLYKPVQDCITIKTPETAFNRVFKSLWRSYGLSDRLVKDKVDLYHGLSHEIPFDFPEGKVKSVVTIHDLIFLRLPHLYNAADRSIYEKKFRYACQKCDRIIAISQQTASDITEFFKISPKKIDIVYQGCNPIFRSEISSGAKEFLRKKYGLPDSFILYVGTVEERKNLLAIIKAIHMGKIQYPLVVIGRHTQYFKQVKEFIEDHNIKNIFFLQSVFNEELPGIYQLADLFVYPSLFEGFGIPILEALYSRVPVITSTGSCFSEAGGDHSVYINPEDPEELAHAINKTLSDTQMRQLMKEKGYMHALNFEPDKVIGDLMKVYLKVMGIN